MGNDDYDFKRHECVENNVTIKEYNLPFVRYYKSVTIDNNTGKKKVEKKIVMKQNEELVTDVILVSVSAGAINAIGNGLAHLIYACKKKKGKK